MRRVLILVIVVLLCSIANAQQSVDVSLAKRIDDLAAQVLSRPTAGLSVAVARDGKVIFARGYGVANVEHSVPVSPDTVFHICSISKNILAAVLLQLVEQHKLNLDDEVTKYVPEAPTHGHRVTIRQLLNHTSGLYSFTSLPEADTNERLDLTYDQVLGLIKDKPFDFEPGTSWRYNNSGFYLAGMVVERVAHQEYGEYVREHVFKPLGMDSALMCDARMVVPHLSAGYERDGANLVNAPFLSWKLPFAAGAICATAVDLLKWQAALDTGRVLSASSLKLMRTPTTLADGTLINYGLGTRLGMFEGHRILGHTGSGGGFGNAFESFPDDHLTIVVLTNTGSSTGTALTFAADIARTMLRLPETKPLADLPVPKDELNALIGRWDSDEGPVETFEQDSKVHFRVPGTKFEGVLRRKAANVYAFDENIEVQFLVRNGRSVWCTVYNGGLFMDAKVRVP